MASSQFSSPYGDWADTMRSLTFPLTISHDDRHAVPLNVPTVASLRRHSVIATHKGWPSNTPNMPVPVLSQTQTVSLSYVLESGGDIGNDHIRGRNSSSKSQEGSRRAQEASTARRDSATTSKSESAGSSPTTTISTTDSLLTGSSPSSSPESPTSSSPMHNFTSSKSPSADSHVSTSASNPLGSPTGFDSDSPGRRPRNVKSLSINTRGISTRPASTAAIVQGDLSTSSMPAEAASAVPGRVANVSRAAASEPSSPSFIMPPIRKSRSKHGLTISTSDAKSAVPSTPGFAPPSFGHRRQASSIPETPALKRFPTLRESEESVFSPTAPPEGGMSFPQLNRPIAPSLPTPSLGPQGGMTLPPLSQRDPSPQRPPSRPALSLSNKQSFEGGAGSSVIQHMVEHTPDEPIHELPLSREVKSPSYPAGPACIYPPNVYLYHQPTAAEAREFDVIINVAKEVPNPFVEEVELLKRAQEAKGYTDASVQCELLPAPPLRTLPPRDDEPDTPKASSAGKREPEYIHLPWEHNSHVYESWLETCELIDSRVKSGKKVLIHCQLGVSRSASLIVAYGLYRDPTLTPDEARANAKKQSKWIDINMHFMYELGDFKKILLRKSGPDFLQDRPAPPPPPLARTMTESFLTTHHDSIKEDAESRRASIADPVSRDEPSSTPADANWSPTEPSLHDEPFDQPLVDKSLESLSDHPARAIGNLSPQAEASVQEVQVNEAEGEDSSDIPTPVRAEATTKSSELEPPSWSVPETSPMFTSRLSNPARDLHNLSELEPQLPPNPPLHQTIPLAPPAPAEPEEEDVPKLTPPRRLRPAPSMPAGFRSIRKPSPALTLDTQATQDASKATVIEPPADNAGTGAPELPPLDFGSSLMSPRTSEFVANPFHRNSLAGDLAGLDELLTTGLEAKDPRSPPQRGEHPITRNIDDVL